MSAPPPLLIACCGNSSAGDDALGPLVARALLAEGLPPEVEVLDLGADPTTLVGHLNERAALVIVDAMALDCHAAGELIDCRWADARRAFFGSDARKSSTHGLGLAD